MLSDIVQSLQARLVWILQLIELEQLTEATEGTASYQRGRLVALYDERSFLRQLLTTATPIEKEERTYGPDIL